MALQIPLNEPRNSKEKRTEETTPFTSTHNPNANIFPIMKPFILEQYQMSLVVKN